MKFYEEITLATLVIGILIIHCPPTSSGESLFPTWELKNPFANVTIHKQIQSFVSTTYYSVIDKIIVKLVKILTEKERQNLEKDEPFEYDFIYRFKIKEKDIKATGYLENATLPNSSKFELRNLTSYKRDNAVHFDILWKHFTANDVNYDMNGKAFDIPINGYGKMYANFTNLQVNGTINYHYKNGTMQVKKMQLQYTFKELVIKITGMNIPLLTKERVNEMVSSHATNYLRKNQPKVSRNVSFKLKKKINNKLQQFTFINFLKYLWSRFTASSTETRRFNDLTNVIDSTFGKNDQEQQ